MELGALSRHEDRQRLASEVEGSLEVGPVKSFEKEGTVL